jgi:hypothetical protein
MKKIPDPLIYSVTFCCVVLLLVLIDQYYAVQVFKLLIKPAYFHFAGIFALGIGVITFILIQSLKFIISKINS